MIEKQIELEKQMTQTAKNKFRNEYQKNINNDNFSNTQTGSVIISNIISQYSQTIQSYLDNYGKGKAVRCTIAAEVISRMGADTAAYISSKVILNSLNLGSIQAIYRAIGQALEDEYKMQKYSTENKDYYRAIQRDLNSRGAKANRKKYITMNMFNKRLNFHLEKWSVTEKVQTGMILLNLFHDVTGLIVIETAHRKRKAVKLLKASEKLLELCQDLNNKLEVMQPFFLPMVCEPKEWTDVLNGGYLSPFLKQNKAIKNNDREYLKKLKTYGCSSFYEALNTIQKTSWKINREVLDVVKILWQEGQAVAGLPSRYDTPIDAFPFPNAGKDTIFSENEKQLIKQWKDKAYEAYKANVAERSNRILTSQIIRIADNFKDYPKIWFPYQADFRGRLYPIPVLLQPQGGDIAKGLLTFGEGKPLNTQDAVKWFKIHGANMYGEDKCSYNDRVKWVNEHSDEIIRYAKEPLENRGWMKADKPFQFLAWCFEYKDFQTNPDFKTYIPVQLDGTCNGLQHYSALLRDKKAGKAVNLINAEKPNDIYATVAERLIEKLKENPEDIAKKWLSLGINRKLSKRPVMILPYGGSQIACRAYIGDYLRENYSIDYLKSYFQIGNNAQDCIYKASNWLSKYLWEAIRETLKSAIVGMDYLKSVARLRLQYKKSIEWVTPMKLLVHQAYQKGKDHEIKTELFGKTVKCKYRYDTENIDKQKQLNGICPNFIHSMDASCLMLWLKKCKEHNLDCFMSVHDCYGVLAPDTELSARLLREAFVEIYQRPVLEDFTADLTEDLPDDVEIPELPQFGLLEIEDVKASDYFFN